MIKNLLNLFFPEACYSCSNLLLDNEKGFCTTCRHNLPVTNYHFNDSKVVGKIFYGRVKIEQATALLRFQKKGLVQQLLHNLKYRGYEDIGVLLGNWLGNELNTLPNYQSIDIVIPVPIHKRKLQRRGYNQVAKFGIHIAKALQAEYIDDVLIKITYTKTQVFKKRISRWDNNDIVFSIQNESKIKNKHILLVDDIITTGATIEACINTLNKKRTHKISIATMAIAE